MFDDIDELMEEQLITKCQPYLNLLKHLAKNGIKRPLVRGAVEDFSELTRINFTPRTQTMNMSQRDSEIANEWFKEQFGIAARTDTVFTTTNRGMASSYGSINMIFPIGKFSIIHSEKNKDLFFTLNPKNILNELVRMDVDLGEKPTIENYKEVASKIMESHPEEYQQAVRNILDNSDYRKNDYANAFKSGHEIMLRCKAYYIVRDSDRIEDFINDFIWDDVI